MTDHLTTDLIIDYLHGELPPEDDASVHAHLDDCAPCRREYEVEASLGEQLRAAAARDEREFPSIIAAEIWQAVRDARPGPFARVLGFLRPAITVPVAAVLAVGIFFATSVGHGGNIIAPKIAATYYLQVHAAQEAQNPLAERGSTASAIESSALDSGNTTELADDADMTLAAPAAFDVVR